VATNGNHAPQNFLYTKQPELTRLGLQSNTQSLSSMLPYPAAPAAAAAAAAAASFPSAFACLAALGLLRQLLHQMPPTGNCGLTIHTQRLTTFKLTVV
jgi:hypothetical protein